MNGKIQSRMIVLLKKTDSWPSPLSYGWVNNLHNVSIFRRYTTRSTTTLGIIIVYFALPVPNKIFKEIFASIVFLLRTFPLSFSLVNTLWVECCNWGVILEFTVHRSCFLWINEHFFSLNMSYFFNLVYQQHISHSCVYLPTPYIRTTDNCTALQQKNI